MVATEKAQGGILTKPNQPNIPKYFSYKLAHDQIKRAIESNPPFPIEAIAIEESILFDRLRSAVLALVPKKASTKSFSKIFEAVYDKQTHTATHGFEGLGAALTKKGGFEALDNWRKGRNRFIHGLARSVEPGQPTEIGSDVFYVEGLFVAREGLALVRIVESWSQKNIRAAKKASSKNKA